ncbi:MAG: CPBP family intramembrane metalloprotease [Oscillospiraceae bacterium]|nr:CPBP family intramembrane metalloprotease [Oscillospiraceae bacterium]
MNYTTPPPQMYYPQDFTPDREEKKKIRKNYNTVGLVLLVLNVLTIIICSVCYDIFCPEVIYDEYGATVIGLKEAIIGGCFPAIMAMLTFGGYCLCARYNPKELFSTEKVKGGEVCRYALIVLMLQQVSFFITVGISTTLYAMGLEVPDMNMVYEHKPSVYAADVIASVILAPIGEELIYRGVVLRCCAKVSRRFAIFFSAFVFGIMHGNPYQFVLGFILGIPLAIITIRTGSLIPAIICHMANNFFACIPTVVGYFDESASYIINVIYIPLFLLIGIFAFVPEIISGRMKLPEYTEYHRKRTFPIMITSWSMIIAMAIFVYDLIRSVQPIAEVVEDVIEKEL